MQNETLQIQTQDQFLILQNRIKEKGLWEAYQQRLTDLFNKYKNKELSDANYLYLFEEAIKNFGRDVPLN